MRRSAPLARAARYLNAIVIKQAVICGAAGYAIAAVIALIIAAAARTSPAAILLTPSVLALLAVAALLHVLSLGR